MFLITVKMYWCWIAVSIQHRQKSKQSAGVSPRPRVSGEDGASFSQGGEPVALDGLFPTSVTFLTHVFIFWFHGGNSAGPDRFCPRLIVLSYFRNSGKWIPQISTVGASSFPLASASFAGQDECPAAVTCLQLQSLVGQSGKAASTKLKQSKETLPSHWLKQSKKDLELIKGWDLFQLRLCKKVTED